MDTEIPKPTLEQLEGCKRADKKRSELVNQVLEDIKRKEQEKLLPKVKQQVGRKKR